MQVHSTRSGECSLIYARPVGRDRVALLIFAQDHDDTTVVNLVVNVERFSKVMAQPDHMAAALQGAQFHFRSLNGLIPEYAVIGRPS